jgi:hypothetical protein
VSDRLEAKVFRENLNKFIDRNADKLKPEQLENIKNALTEWDTAIKPLQDNQNLQRMGAQSGITTGRSLFSLGATYGLGSALGPGGALAGAAFTPMMNPNFWLATMKAARMGDKTALRIINNPESQKIISGMIRSGALVATDENEPSPSIQNEK